MGALPSPSNHSRWLAYDAYAALVRRAEGVPGFVELQPPLWAYDRAKIGAAITPRIRAIVLNKVQELIIST